jgi:hypothetical protein
MLRKICLVKQTNHDNLCLSAKKAMMVEAVPDKHGVLRN